MSTGETPAPRVQTDRDDETTTRTRSVWSSQLLLAAVVVVVALIVQTLSPEQFTSWAFSSGVAAIVVITALSLAVPWDRLPRMSIIALPMLDIVAIGLMEFGSGLYTSFLWVFPAVWIATHFRLGAMISAGALICVLTLAQALVGERDEAAAARLLIVLLSLTFLSLSTHLTSRRTQAFQTLLRRQAGKLQDTVSRVRAQERRVRFLLDALDLGVVRVTGDGRILTINEFYTRLYGLDPDQPGAPGRSVEYATLRGEPLPPERRPLARATAREAVEEERVWLFDGEGVWHALAVTIRPLPSSVDEEASTLLMVREVTALIESQQARERIATIVSHELRNPLTAILGHAELLADDPALPPHAREQVQVIEGASQRMRHLIDEILTRPDGERVEISARTPIDLRRIATASVASFQPAADAGGITVRVTAAAALPAIGDAFRLRQVVDNLLSNAIKYTPRGGTVEVQGAVGERTVRLRVVDDGVGIAPADLPRVFDPYFRAATARASSVGGTGLGLGIARTIVEGHGGTLTIDSAQGSGTTATLTLPVAEEAP